MNILRPLAFLIALLLCFGFGAGILPPGDPWRGWARWGSAYGCLLLASLLVMWRGKRFTGDCPPARSRDWVVWLKRNEEENRGVNPRQAGRPPYNGETIRLHVILPSSYPGYSAPEMRSYLARALPKMRVVRMRSYGGNEEVGGGVGVGVGGGFGAGEEGRN